MTMRRFSRMHLLFLALVVALASPAHAAGSWTVVPSPSPGAQANYLAGVTAISPTDVWSVGAWYRPSGTPGTLTEHWDGSVWTVVPSPNATPGYNELFGVAALSSNDVWAVGYHNIALYGSEKTMALHWDGVGWTIVPTRNIGTQANMLQSVAAVAADDVWAVGFGSSPSNRAARVLVQRWNGTRWSLVRTPDLGRGFGVLNDIVALAADDIWAVGGHDDSTLIEHWDGSVWTVVPSPNGMRGDSELYAVDALAPDDVWAFGDSDGNGAGDSLVLHWDGSAWTVVPSPNGAKPFTSINDVTAVGPDDIWAVGTTYNQITVSFRTFTMHWDGTAWTTVESPNPDQEYNALYGAASVPGGAVWAVGNAGIDTLTMRNTP